VKTDHNQWQDYRISCLRIWDTVETQELAIVILDPKYSMVNVIAYDKLGNPVWTIEKADFVMDGSGYCVVEDFQVRLIAHSRGVHFSLIPKQARLLGPTMNGAAVIIVGLKVNLILS